MIIQSVIKKYQQELESLDLELLLAAAIARSREFVLAHPEYELSRKDYGKFARFAARRMEHKPIAYILGHKEFYGSDFKVNRHTLIPRPETEMMVEMALERIKGDKHESMSVIDVGTGSGNIAISIARGIKDSELLKEKTSLFAVDISEEALRVAKHNAKKNDVDKKIKFIKSDLLNEFIQNSKFKIPNSIIVANLPYLSKEIYSATMPDVKIFEPKSALYSARSGLSHYERLLEQIRKINGRKNGSISCAILEISPEQKQKLLEIIKEILPGVKTGFRKDLSGRWRMCVIDII
ncbi:MAG: peptide chain release factor N(5)-glutamine methyltransferase [Candidatus Moranbacteria bacterium]|nr:peptide chain release factor N(5)-glutamine methyltransferase [Candidatus Moranbacteria bacterium]